jgi:hypothetical protein
MKFTASKKSDWLLAPALNLDLQDHSEFIVEASSTGAAKVSA